MTDKVQLGVPIHPYTELNPSCNLMCQMCVISVETNPKSSKKFWFPLDRYKGLIDEDVAKGLKSVQPNNINELLIRKDQYARQSSRIHPQFFVERRLTTPYKNDNDIIGSSVN